MRDFIYNHKKGIIITLAIAFFAILIISFYFIIMNKINSATVNIRVTPLEAEVKIDGKKYEVMKSYRIKPGEYSIEVSAEGFVSKSGNFSVDEGEIYDVDIFLEPTAENAKWYEEHPDDALILGEIKGSLNAKAVQKLQDENPILSELPMNIDYYTNNGSKRIKYTISYKLEDNNTRIVLTITDYTGGNYNDAISRLENRGVKEDKYEIKYVDKSKEEKWGRAGD